MIHPLRLACGSALALVLAAGLSASPAHAVTQERLLNAEKEEGNWLHHHRTYAGHRFAPLKEINKDTVKNLKVAWTLALGGIERGGIWTPWRPRGHADRRGRLPLRHRRLGLGLQGRHPRR